MIKHTTLTIIARISAKTADNQIPFIPKMEGLIKIMITWKTSVLKKEIRAYKAVIKGGKEGYNKNMKYEDLKGLKDKKFKKLVGIPRDLFDLLITTLQHHFESKESKGGPKPKLCIEDILLMTLYFYRNYVTFFNLGIIYKLDESNAYRWVRWTEAVLLMEFEGAIDITFLDEDSDQLIDVTECSIQRPKDSQMQEEFYSGKKKKNTQSKFRLS